MRPPPAIPQPIIQPPSVLQIPPLLPVRPLSPGLKPEIRPPLPVEEVLLEAEAPQRGPGLIRRRRNEEIAQPYHIGKCIQIIILLVNAKRIH